jgi:hypothetical protein
VVTTDTATVILGELPLSESEMARLRLQQQAATTTTSVASASTTLTVAPQPEYLKDWELEAIPKLFPDILPFGRGGPSEARAVPVGLEACIRHYVRLSGRMFARHPTFTLLVTDILSRRRAVQGAFFNVPTSGRRVDFAQVSVNQLVAALQQRERESDARASGRALPPRPAELEAALALLQRVDSGARASWGSEQEKLALRNQAWALCLAFGDPTFMLTINPNDLGSLMVHRLCSCNGGSLAELPSLADRLANLRMDPIGPAQWFDMAITAVIQHLLGFDVQTGKTLKRGILGPVRAFFGVTESQGRGSLHVHMLVWVAGVPERVLDGNKVLKEVPGACELLLRYFDSTVCSSYAIDLSDCPECGGHFGEVPKLVVAAQKKQTHGELHIIECESCKFHLTASELFRRTVSWLARTMHDRDIEAAGYSPAVLRAAAMLDGSEAQRTAMNTLICQPLGQPFSRNSVPQRLVLALLQWEVVCHDYHHSDACLKKVGAVSCRFLLPKLCAPVSSLATVTKAGKEAAFHFVSRRTIGSQYLASHSLPLLYALRCNCEIRPLVFGSGPNAVFYAVRYTTKPLELCQTPAALAVTALERKILRAAATATEITGNSVLASVLHATTSKHQLSAQECGLLLLRGSSVYTSHEFVTITLRQFKNFVMALPTRVTLSARGGVVCSTSTLQRYIDRPAEQASLSAWKWASQKKPNGRIPVPLVLGGRLPDVRSLDVENSGRVEQAVADQRELYAAMALSLFVPFRSLADLRTLGGDGMPIDTLWSDWLARSGTIASDLLPIIANY